MNSGWGEGLVSDQLVAVEAEPAIVHLGVINWSPPHPRRKYSTVGRISVCTAGRLQARPPEISTNCTGGELDVNVMPGKYLLHGRYK